VTRGIAVSAGAHRDGTRASIRIRGDAAGFYRLAGPPMAVQVRGSIGKDLRDLDRILTR
jgi:hypothetical protein